MRRPHEAFPIRILAKKAELPAYECLELVLGRRRELGEMADTGGMNG